MTTYYKAVRPDGTDFHTGRVQWAPPEGHEGEWVVRHPTATKVGGEADQYLSVSTEKADCTGMKWPCKLLTVEPVGEAVKVGSDLPNKRAGVAFRVTGELPAHEALGPNGQHVAALIERARTLTPNEAERLHAAGVAARNAAGDAARNAAGVAAWVAAGVAAWVAAGDAARDAAGDAARDAAGDAARDAARYAAGDAARYAALALIVRDVLAPEHYETLTRPWRDAIGHIHPEDGE